jgi:hypothetical protein
VVRAWRALAAGAVASVAGHGVPGVETHHPVQVVAQRLARALGVVRRAGPGPGQRAGAGCQGAAEKRAAGRQSRHGLHGFGASRDDVTGLGSGGQDGSEGGAKSG